MTRGADVIVVGGGVMGWSSAFWLTRLDPTLRCLVLERDPTLARSATALSVASIRQQFSTEVNVKISRFGIQFIKTPAEYTGIEADLHFRGNGYLFLAKRPSEAAALRQSAEMQRRLGASTQVLEPSELALAFPWLKLDDVELGTFGPKDKGWFDNIGLVQLLKEAALRQGARSAAVEASSLAQGSSGWRVATSTGEVFACERVVLAAGTGTRDLLQTLGEGLPVEIRKRTVFVIDAPKARSLAAPLMVVCGGIYARPEGRVWLCAETPSVDAAVAPDAFDIDWAGFEDKIWPALYERSELFDAVKIVGAWAGHYDFNTLDQNAFVGAWPGLRGLYVLNGFSGHGLQQAPAVGRGVAELLLHGRYVSLDLTVLRPDRFSEAGAQAELAVV